MLLVVPVLVELDKELRSRSGISADSFTTDITFTSRVDAGLAISAKTYTAIVGSFYDEEQVGACTSILGMGSPDAKQIRSWFFIA